MNPNTFIGLPLAYRSKIIKNLKHVNFNDEVIDECIKKKIESPSDVIDLACLHFDVQRKDIIGPSHKREFTEPRQICLSVIIRLFPNETLKNIGKIFNRHHTSIIHSRETVNDCLDTDPKFKKRFTDFLNRM